MAIRDKQPDADVGRVRVDNDLESLEKRITVSYGRAAKDITTDLDAFLAKFEAKDAKKREDVENGLLSEDDYIDWRKRQIFQSDAMKAKIDDLSQRMVNADKQAMAMVNNELPEIYATSYNFGGFRGEMYAKAAGFDYTQFTIINEDAVKTLMKEDPDLIPWKPDVDGRTDKAWNRKHIQNAVEQGIIKGEGMDKISRRLLPVVGMDKNAAIRTARTAVNGVENKGRMDATQRVVDAGIPMVMQWSCTHDSRTRYSHALMDGEIISLGEEFSNGLKYPADPDGDPAEVYNCRCAAIPTLEGIDHSKDDELYEQFMEDNYYEDWVKVKEDREEKEAQFADRKEKAKEWAGKQQEKALETGVAQDVAPITETKQNDDRSILGLEPPQRPRQADYGGYTDEYLAARDAYHVEREEYEKKINEAKQAALDRTAFTTKEEVQTWANDMNIAIADPRVLDEVDIRAFNDVKPALEEMFERYPEVKEFYIEMEDGSLFKTSFEMGIDDHCLMSASRGLNFSLSNFEDYSNALNYGLQGMAEGVLCKGDGTFETLVRHEYGHRVQDFLQTSLRNKYHDNVTDWRKNFDTFEEKKASMDKYRNLRDEMDRELRALSKLGGASEYSHTNDLELFAEGFAEYSSGGQSEFGIAFGKYVEKWWNICT